MSNKTKECPSCAMQVDSDEEICPICQYEFPKQSKVSVWVAVVLIILLLLLFVF
jgi:RNA polymerase subunit RPABC4/transcription elongation factor Spt4